MNAPLYLAIDVGTGSARAGIFDASGARQGLGVAQIRIWREGADFVEQSSDDIWRAVGEAVRVALAEGNTDPTRIRGIGVDATCSLVVLDDRDGPVSVSPSGDDARNVIVWMDHRATDQARRINDTRHDVLRFVGNVISPEMQTPKLLWLAEKLPRAWSRAARFFDLPDFLSYRATRNDTRSLCTTVCKWTYLGHAGEGGRWSDDYFRRIGLGALVDERYERIGTRVRPMGERVGSLTEDAARDLGLPSGTPVAVSIIDAHAGGLGVLGATLDGIAPSNDTLEQRLALVCGTSTCHMAVSAVPRFVPGVWGPYFSAMVPGMWLTEGGQSATGALLDLTVRSHARARELELEAAANGTTVYAILNDRITRLARGAGFPAELARDIHVLPDHHGNRSPRADPTLRGMVSGLSLDDSIDGLAVAYLATLQALAYGTRHILDALRAQGYPTTTLLACGGDAKNPLFLREHADATGCRIVLSAEPEAVLLGSAMLGAVAAGSRATLVDAMGAMSRAGKIIEPTGGSVRAYHDAKYAVFQRMHGDQMAYREIMSRS
ncbi:MAG TPA: FGGY-family carbohydrate kinase [Polyangiaceae bacterium]|nr:FGGY-family carbohydrate kinase [Polyangiaceae bacterium]